MRHLRVITGLALTALALTMAGESAMAADETATSSLSMTSIAGGLFRELPKPVNWKVGVEIKAPYPGSSVVTPLKEIHASLPQEMTFNPDPDMPVCPDDKVGPKPTNLSVPPETAIARCPDSVIGNGTAEHYLARINDSDGPTLRDAVVVIFNGGRTAEGLPKIKIYGYSQGAGTGIYMVGVLDDGQLDVSIPVLPFDSATGKFNLSIPGTDESHAERRGQDPDYVRATCNDGDWEGQVDFLLGTRNDSGAATSPESTVAAPPLSVPCSGVSGSPRLGKLKVKGPATAVQGKKTTFRVTIPNSGSATAKSVKVIASGKGAKGKSPAVSIAPGKSKTVKVKVKVSFTRKGQTRVKFKASGRGVSVKTASKSVKVK
ncbi:MAG: hypothetical protein JJE13_05740 [Thermoleophilia bacterium]|nr:hypothetical protein [Thermoleophilia bacterium]